MITLKGNVVTVDKVHKAAILVENGRISRISDVACKQGKTFDFGDCWIVPGFIDIHTHGIGEYSMCGLDKSGWIGENGIVIWRYSIFTFECLFA